MNRGASSADRDWFRLAVATGQPYLGLPDESRATGRPVVPFSVPIVAPNGTVAGVLVAGIDLGDLSDWIINIDVGPQGRVALNDSRGAGTILSHIDRRRILTPVSGRNEAQQRMQAGERGAIEHRSSTGETTLAAFAPVPGVPWGVLVQRPRQAAFLRIEEMTRGALLLTGVIVLLTALLSVLLALQIVRLDEEVAHARVVLERECERWAAWRY